jgi:hypothetical protein
MVLTTAWPIDSGGDVSERGRVRAGPAALALIERVDLFGVAGLEPEIERLEVLPDPRRRHRLGGGLRIDLDDTGAELRERATVVEVEGIPRYSRVLRKR